MKLFDIPEKNQPTTKCKQCEHSERHQCNSNIIWYCGLRKSRRTANGLLKIKANQISCDYFKTSR